MDLQLRKTTLGGSDFSIILGTNPWKTPRKLAEWQLDPKKAKNPRASIDNYKRRRGSYLEDFVRGEYERRRKCVVETVPMQQEVPFGPSWLRCSPDGIVRGKDGEPDILYEGKTASIGIDWTDESLANFRIEWGDAGTDCIPLHYVPQVHLYGWAYDLPLIHLVVDLSGEYRLYEMKTDRSYVLEQLLPAGDAWMTSILAGRMPEAVKMIEEAAA